MFLTKNCPPWLAIGGSVLSIGIIVVVLHPYSGSVRYLVDLDVYRHGSEALIRGGNLYHHAFLTHEAPLPFTYPPFAAIVLSPLSVPPLWLASLLLSALSLMSLVVSLAAVGQWCRCPTPWLWGWALSPLVILTEPVLSTLMYGQINGVLLAAVLGDASGLFRRYVPWLPVGLVTGIAAAVKLTPLFFVCYFFAIRHWRALWALAAGAGGATLVAALVAPYSSWDFVTSVVWNTHRIGAAHYGLNVGISGIYARWGLPSQWWVITVAVVVVGVGVAARRTAHHSQLLAFTMVALGNLLVSPISWSHHWVWVPVCAVVMLLHHQWGLGMWMWCAVTVGAFHAMLPNHNDVELHWLWWQHLAAAHYVIVSVGAIVLVWLRAPHMPKPQQEFQLRLAHVSQLAAQHLRNKERQLK